MDPKSTAPIGEPPAWLAPDEAAAWREFVANAPARVLTAGDRWTLALAAKLMAEFRRDEAVSPGRVGLLMRCLGELGATPAARARVAPAAPETPAASPWDRLA